MLVLKLNLVSRKTPVGSARAYNTIFVVIEWDISCVHFSMFQKHIEYIRLELQFLTHHKFRCQTQLGYACLEMQPHFKSMNWINDCQMELSNKVRLVFYGRDFEYNIYLSRFNIYQEPINHKRPASVTPCLVTVYEWHQWSLSQFSIPTLWCGYKSSCPIPYFSSQSFSKEVDIKQISANIHSEKRYRYKSSHLIWEVGRVAHSNFLGLTIDETDGNLQKMCAFQPGRIKH